MAALPGTWSSDIARATKRAADRRERIVRKEQRRVARKIRKAARRAWADAMIAANDR
jgi:hypothetical protein